VGIELPGRRFEGDDDIGDNLLVGRVNVCEEDRNGCAGVKVEGKCVVAGSKTVFVRIRVSLL